MRGVHWSPGSPGGGPGFTQKPADVLHQRITAGRTAISAFTPSGNITEIHRARLDLVSAQIELCALETTRKYLTLDPSAPLEKRLTSFHGIDKLLDQKMAATQTQALGTPGFAAPEQWKRGQVSFATDLFGAAAIAYYLLTGTTPYTDVGLYERSGYSTLQKPPQISKEFWAVLYRALHPEKEKRFQTAAQMRGAIKNIGKAGSAPAAGLAGSVQGAPNPALASCSAVKEFPLLTLCGNLTFRVLLVRSEPLLAFYNQNNPLFGHPHMDFGWDSDARSFIRMVDTDADDQLTKYDAIVLVFPKASDRKQNDPVIPPAFRHLFRHPSPAWPQILFVGGVHSDVWEQSLLSYPEEYRRKITYHPYGHSHKESDPDNYYDETNWAPIHLWVNHQFREWAKRQVIKALDSVGNPAHLHFIQSLLDQHPNITEAEWVQTGRPWSHEFNLTVTGHAETFRSIFEIPTRQYLQGSQDDPSRYFSMSFVYHSGALLSHQISMGHTAKYVREALGLPIEPRYSVFDESAWGHHDKPYLQINYSWDYISTLMADSLTKYSHP